MPREFSDLPPELRLKIYELVFEPREIYLEVKMAILRRTSSSTAETFKSSTPILTTRGAPSSILLQLCGETRQKYYRPLFQGQLTAPVSTQVETAAGLEIVMHGMENIPQSVWVNPNIDVIVLSRGRMRKLSPDYPLFTLGNLEDIACIKSPKL